MSRRQPVIVLLAVSFLILFMVMNYFQIRGILVEVWAGEQALHEAKLQTYFDIGRQFGNAGEWDIVHERLNLGLLKGDIDFFILQYDGEPLWFGEKDGNLDRINFKFTKTDVLVVQPKLTYETFAFPDGAHLTIGQYKYLDKFLDRVHDQFEAVYYDEAALVLIIIVLAGLWSLRDIRALVERIKRGKYSETAPLTAHSAESEIFLRGLKGYQQNVIELEQANTLMGKQILPSLKNELFSGKKPPYDFECTLVRTDINNFSTIYNTNDVTQFMGTINEFFIDVSLVVSRYGGFIHEFVGDEVIFYFKDEDHSNSFMVALSALRDINTIAAGVNARTSEQNGYPFTVKSSLAHGRVRFGALVNGFTIAGSVLIETVRILAHIHEKDGNVIYFDQSNTRFLDEGLRHEEALRVQLKGFKGDRILDRYVSHPELGQVLSSLSDSTVGKLSFYRSDIHIAEILNWLRASERELSEGLMLKALGHLRKFSVLKSEVDFATFICDWLDDLTSVERAPNGGALRLASAVVMMLISLVPKDQLKQDVIARLRAVREVGDRRLSANVVEVLTHFEVAEDLADLKAQGDDHDARLLANALIQSGRGEISKQLLQRFKKMLSSKRSDQIASALFALGEVSLYHRKRDPVYYSTQLSFQDLLQTLPRYVSHSDMTVRRQAFVAAAKASDPLIIEKMWDKAELIPRAAAEARLHLPPRLKAA